MIGPAAATDAVDGALELMLAFPSSRRGDVTSLLSDAPPLTASPPDLEGSRLARIGFLTESEDSEKLPPFEPAAQSVPPSVPLIPPSSKDPVPNALSVGAFPSLSGGIGGAGTCCCCCCCCTLPDGGCAGAASWVIVLALSRTEASHLANR